jgi:hypothetical protein
LNVPEAVGVPLMVIVFEAQEAVTPGGRPVAVPMPVAPVVVWVSSVRVSLTHKVGAADAWEAVFSATVFDGTTVIVPVAVALPQPPVSGML